MLITTKSRFRDSVSVGMSRHCREAARSLWDMATPWPARRAAPRASNAACERTGFLMIAAIIEPPTATVGEMNCEAEAALEAVLPTRSIESRL